MRLASTLLTVLSLASTTAMADTAALSGWSGQTADFLSDGESMSHFINANSTTTSKPIRIGNHNWPGLKPYAHDIVAAMNISKREALFFLSDGTYLKYSIAKQKPMGKPREMSVGGMRLLKPFAKDIKAAFQWNSGYAFIFLDNGLYLRYNIAQQRIDQGYPKRITNQSWPGLGEHATDIETIVNWGQNQSYVFLNDGRYLLYDKRADRVADGYPKRMSNDTWNQMGDWFAKELKGKDHAKSRNMGGCRELRARRHDSPRAERQFEKCRANKRKQKRLALKLQTIAIDYYNMNDQDFSRVISRRGEPVASLSEGHNFERKRKRNRKNRGALCHTVGRLPMDVFAEISELDLNETELALIQKSCRLQTWK